jgi:hypothetical protein
MFSIGTWSRRLTSSNEQIVNSSDVVVLAALLCTTDTSPRHTIGRATRSRLALKPSRTSWSQTYLVLSTLKFLVWT